jgi:20S proteasome alpha/beta subunit
MGCLTSDDKIVVLTDSAIGDAMGFRRIMSEGKWWNMGCLMIGESGSDFALSRIRAKTAKHEPWTDLRDPYTFSELVCEVQSEVRGELGTEPIEAELLHVSGDENNKPILHVIGGDGGISGPFPYTAVGHGSTIALPLMDILLSKKYFPGKRTEVAVLNKLTEIMEIVARYADSVSDPFYHRIFDPAEEFKEL